MNEKKILVLVIITLIVIIIFSLFSFHKLKQKKLLTEANSIHQQTILNDELNTYRHNFKINILNSKENVKNLCVKDSLDNIISLRTIFSKNQEKVVVCRFSKRHCESCVNSSIQILKNWVDSIGRDNVMFLGNYRNNRIFTRTMPLYGIHKQRVFNTPKFNLPVEELGYPYYFVLDSGLQVSNIFVPDKGTPQITNKYLEMIRNRF